MIGGLSDRPPTLLRLEIIRGETILEGFPIAIQQKQSNKSNPTKAIQQKLHWSFCHWSFCPKLLRLENIYDERL